MGCADKLFYMYCEVGKQLRCFFLLHSFRKIYLSLFPIVCVKKSTKKRENIQASLEDVILIDATRKGKNYHQDE
jgi:hypothetical protein